MSSSSRTIALAAGTLMAVIGSASIAGAQQQLKPVRVSTTLAEATSQHMRGQVLGDSLHKIRTASRHHERSAELRSANDPQAFECMREAALLRYYSGDRRGSVALMEKAAELAVGRGDVINASRTFSDAAIIAHETRQPARAWNLGVRAEGLSASPLLTDAQRTTLRSQLVQLDRSTQTVSRASGHVLGH